jgi:hypothetical protein
MRGRVNATRRVVVVCGRASREQHGGRLCGAHARRKAERRDAARVGRRRQRRAQRDKQRHRVVQAAVRRRVHHALAAAVAVRRQRVRQRARARDARQVTRHGVSSVCVGAGAARRERKTRLQRRGQHAQQRAQLPPRGRVPRRRAPRRRQRHKASGPTRGCCAAVSAARARRGGAGEQRRSQRRHVLPVRRALQRIIHALIARSRPLRIAHHKAR